MSALCMYAHSRTIACLKRKRLRRNLDEVERAIIEAELVAVEIKLQRELRGWEERRQERVGSN